MSKNIVFLFGLAILSSFIISCGKSSKMDGQLIGVTKRPDWKGVNPYGMIYVKSGTLTIGSDDQDISSNYLSRPKSISIQGFYMDETEIANNENRQFVNWVRDSIAHTIQGNFEEDVDKLVYNYEWLDWKQAAADRGKSTRKTYIKKDKTKIYPDTMVWIRDFAYSYNEPMTRNYFWHPAFDDYPVVGVNWKAANAFCSWRSKIWDTYRPEDVHTEGFRLPTEFEWEYAARGGHENAPYPWGAYGLRNSKGCLLANFKPRRGNYPEDGGQWTVKADAYFPNDYGFYCMSGNVAEWTLTAYAENAYAFIHDLNPDIRYDAKDEDPEGLKRKVIRGGSWKDIGYFLRTGTRHYEFQDSAKSYVGFRCVLTHMGRSINDF